MTPQQFKKGLNEIVGETIIRSDEDWVRQIQDVFSCPEREARQLYSCFLSLGALQYQRESYHFRWSYSQAASCYDLVDLLSDS